MLECCFFPFVQNLLLAGGKFRGIHNPSQARQSINQICHLLPFFTHTVSQFPLCSSSKQCEHFWMTGLSVMSILFLSIFPPLEDPQNTYLLGGTFAQTPFSSPDRFLSLLFILLPTQASLRSTNLLLQAHCWDVLPQTWAPKPFSCCQIGSKCESFSLQVPLLTPSDGHCFRQLHPLICVP